MNNVTVSTVRNRVYPHKFDWDEARRLYAAGGHTYKSLAEKFGVSSSAIEMAIRPERRRRMLLANAEKQTRGTCVDCGGRCSQNGSSRVQRCRPCAYLKASTSVRDDALKCHRCGEWKWDPEFPWDRSKRSDVRRGRHRGCRPCLTEMRRDYRERQKVPCVGCGTPALPPSEKRSNGAAFPRCRECASADRRNGRMRIVEAAA